MLNFLARLFRSWAGRERLSPNDWVKRDQITYDKTEGVLKVKLPPNVEIFDVANTKSMDGLMDYKTNVIGTDNFDKAELIAGDDIIYQVYTTLIVHRIINIREDASGRIYQCRGINNLFTDSYYLRDENIKYVVIGQFN